VLAKSIGLDPFVPNWWGEDRRNPLPSGVYSSLFMGKEIWRDLKKKKRKVFTKKGRRKNS
jgi:hypothetical protein